MVEAGIDVLCITDHNAIRGAVELAGAAAVPGDRRRGAAHARRRDHRAVPHRAHPASARRPREAAERHPRPGRRRLRARTRSTRCAATWPSRRCYELADAGLVDAVEVLNAKTSLRSLNERAAEFADEFDLAAGAGSDAHVPHGARRGLRGDARLRRPGRLPAPSCARVASSGHHWDEHRPWTAAHPAQRRHRVELHPVPIIHAIVLGLVQGLAEFLPISSSGHLLLVPWLFGWNDFDDHAESRRRSTWRCTSAPLVAVIGYFRKDLVVYVREGTRLRGEAREAGRTPRVAWRGCWCCRRCPRPRSARWPRSTIDEKLGTPRAHRRLADRVRPAAAWADRRAGTRTLDDVHDAPTR